MSIFTYNGSLVIAMTGKNCVAIASDKRLGEQAKTVSCDFQKIFDVGPHIYIGLPGLATDTITFYERLRFRVNLYELRENRKIKPNPFISLVSNMLYEKRFGPYFVGPIIACLDHETGKPHLATMDSIGCITEPEDFAVGGTGEDEAYGLCESMWKPNLEPDELFETISQALMNACDRDSLSGWGGVVHIIEKDKVTVKHLRTRMD